ncbi:hypothetical protein V1477_012446, partial [Vespula maculifrons]
SSRVGLSKGVHKYTYRTFSFKREIPSSTLLLCFWLGGEIFDIVLIRYGHRWFVGLQMQQPPRGETWVGSTCDISKSYCMQVLPGEWLHISI